MSGLTQLRLAALCAFTYALLAVSSVLLRFQRTGSLRVLLRGLANPQMWIVLLLAAMITVGLFRRQAWAWWVGIAAASFGLFRIGSAYVESGFDRVPPTPTLIALVLLLSMLLLLAPRRARLAANR